MLNLTVSLFDYFSCGASTLPTALLYKCQYAALVSAAAAAALTVRDLCFGLGYRKIENGVLEMWVNMNKGVILFLNLHSFQSFNSSPVILPPLSFFFALPCNRLHTEHLCMLKLQMSTHKYVFKYLAG